MMTPPLHNCGKLKYGFSYALVCMSKFSAEIHIRSSNHCKKTILKVLINILNDFQMLFPFLCPRKNEVLLRARTGPAVEIDQRNHGQH